MDENIFIEEMGLLRESVNGVAIALNTLLDMYRREIVRQESERDQAEVLADRAGDQAALKKGR